MSTLATHELDSSQIASSDSDWNAPSSELETGMNSEAISTKPSAHTTAALSTATSSIATSSTDSLSAGSLSNSFQSSLSVIFEKKIKQSDIVLFTSQLSIMCESGLDLAEAIRETAKHCNHPKLKRVLEAIYYDVSNGVRVSTSLKRHESIFGGAYIGSIAAAESSGNVGEVLGRLTELMRNQMRLRSSLISIFSYPAALCAIAMLVVGALIFFVLPQFGTVFERMNATAPPFTRFLLDASAFARQYIIWIGVISATSVVGIYQYAQTEHAKHLWDRMMLDISIFGKASRALITGRIFRLLGTMLESGVPLLDALKLCRDSIGNYYYRTLFDQMEEGVINGQGIGATVTESPYLPSGVAQMVVTAERTGRLGPVISLVGEFYEEDGETQIRQVVKLLEPVIILFMGALVAGVVASVMLPLLNVSTMSR